MRKVRKEDIKQPFKAELGEIIYEMIGRPEEIGATTNHSLVHVEIPAGKRSPNHFHKVSEETYYILKGNAEMFVADNSFRVYPGDVVTIMPNENHTIINDTEDLLEFLTVSAPAWTPDDSYDPLIEKKTL